MPLLPGCVRLPLGMAIVLLAARASSFSPQSRARAAAPERRSPTAIPAVARLSLSAPNGTLSEDEYMLGDLPLVAWNNTLATERIEELEALSGGAVGRSPPSEAGRARLKRELAHAAITSFQPDALPTSSAPSARRTGTGRSAEAIMKELEQREPLPIPRPAAHHSLNAHWSFVFTGVPTIGMRLITLLSRISMLFPFQVLDFRDVALRVLDAQSRAEAVVQVRVCGVWEIVLKVCTSLRRPVEEDIEGDYKRFRGEDGTLLLECFQGVYLNGVKIPTPKHWQTTRTLEITYMDKDIMIARTSGGEPHLLLRNSPPCYMPDELMLRANDEENSMDEEIEECNLDGGVGWTEFFSDAIEIYGERITRCLVDRYFGMEEHRKKEARNRIGTKQ